MAPRALTSARLRRLRRAELASDTLQLARQLIGHYVVHDHPQGRLVGRIVETEAYPPGDPACHAYIGPTARNASLFLRHGHAYVYFIYGTWFMLNVSSERAGQGAGVLLRALEPVAGLDLMRRLRGVETPTELTRGPGRLAQALAIDRALDGVDLCRPGALWLAAGPGPSGEIGVSERIGLTRAVEQPWRFYERGNPHVSGPLRLRR